MKLIAWRPVGLILLSSALLVMVMPLIGPIDGDAIGATFCYPLVGPVQKFNPSLSDTRLRRVKVHEGVHAEQCRRDGAFQHFVGRLVPSRRLLSEAESYCAEVRYGVEQGGQARLVFAGAEDELREVPWFHRFSMAELRDALVTECPGVADQAAQGEALWQASLQSRRTAAAGGAPVVRFVGRGASARVEVLDWGGRGPALLFLPGLGNTAHVYEDFAGRFADHSRPVAMTPRGFGASTPTDRGGPARHGDGGYRRGDRQPRARTGDAGRPLAGRRPRDILCSTLSLPGKPGHLPRRGQRPAPRTPAGAQRSMASYARADGTRLRLRREVPGVRGAQLRAPDSAGGYSRDPSLRRSRQTQRKRDTGVGDWRTGRVHGARAVRLGPGADTGRLLRARRDQIRHALLEPAYRRGASRCRPPPGLVRAQPSFEHRLGAPPAAPGRGGRDSPIGSPDLSHDADGDRGGHATLSRYNSRSPMRDQPDRIDTRILKLLQKNARTTNVEIARLLGMAPSSIMERVRKLEKSGMILGYSARINPRMAGAGLLAFVFCKADKWPPSRTAAIRLAKHAWVQEIHDLSGEDCFVVKLRCKDTDELGAILREHFGSNDLIKSTRTTIVLDTVKESSEVPLT